MQTLVLTSCSAVKIAALDEAIRQLGWDAEIVAVKSPSGVNEQPLGDETERGALNRIRSARQAHPGADTYVSIENGLFEEGGEYVDRAVVVAERADGRRAMARSGGVVFPYVFVEETRRRGFATTTVGQVLADRGIVSRHDDPHLSLCGKSRALFLLDATIVALAALKEGA